MSVTVEIDEGVATLTIDAPATRNALNPTSCAELIAICDRVDADQRIGALIVRGGGTTFCSGAERELLRRAGDDPADPSNFADVDIVYQAFVRVGRLQVPTIAAARGAAVGAGVNLFLATDLRIVANDLRIIAGFLPIGLHPGGGHFTLLGRLVSREAAAAIGVFGEEVSGTRAVELGMAWEAVGADVVDNRARELATRVAKDPALARRVVGSLRTELEPPGVSWAAGLELERGSQMWSLRRRALNQQGDHSPPSS